MVKANSIKIRGLKTSAVSMNQLQQITNPFGSQHFDKTNAYLLMVIWNLASSQRCFLPFRLSRKRLNSSMDRDNI